MLKQIKPLSSNDQLIFIHIPKTAGTSVWLALQEALKSDYKVILRDDINTNKIFKFNINSFVAVSGHFSMDTFQANLTHEKKHVFITVLRNPFERINSLFHYVKQVPAHRYKSIPNFSKLDCYGFINECLAREPSEVSNTFVHYLSNSLLDVTETIKFIENNYCLVGITEKINIFEKNLNILLSKYADPIRFQKINVTKDKPALNLDSKTINLIQDINQYDLKIYDYFYKKEREF